MRFRLIFAMLASASLLGGCIVTSAAGTAVSVTGDVLEAGVDAGGAVIGTAADVVTGDDDDRDRD